MKCLRVTLEEYISLSKEHLVSGGPGGQAFLLSVPLSKKPDSKMQPLSNDSLLELAATLEWEELQA